MKRLLTALLATILPAFALNAQVDSTALSAKLEEYCAAMVAESADMQSAETDFLIGACTDGGVRQFTATWLYDHFYRSKVMGADAVAIHIYDRWFADGSVSFPDPLEKLTADIFAEFNRRSLIGCRAPSISLEYADGTPVELFTEASGRPAVLYIYSPDCSKCRIENIMLRNTVENRDCDIDVYAVCTSTDRQKWEGITSGTLDFRVSTTRIHHLWDPSGDLGWQKKYGVLQTPRMFLIDGEGTIVGRNLDSGALDLMLGEMFDPVELVYGEPESEDLYNGIFESYRSENGKVTPENLQAVAEHIAMRTLEQEKDTVLFRQMTGDLLYYLTNTEDGGLRNGSVGFIDSQILSRGDVWKTESDTLQVVSLALMMKDILSRTPVGEKMPSVDVVGRICRSGKDGRQKTFDLGRIGRRAGWIMFYSPFCQDCREELEALAGRYSSGEKIRVLKVDVGEMEKAVGEEAFEELLSAVDLTHVPLVVSVDRESKVTGKYLSFKDSSL